MSEGFSVYVTNIHSFFNVTHIHVVHFSQRKHVHTTSFITTYIHDTKNYFKKLIEFNIAS